MDSEPPRTGPATATATATSTVTATAALPTLPTPDAAESELGSTALSGGPTDESYSPDGLLDPGSPLLGATIALLALIVPVATVLLERGSFRTDPRFSIPISRGHQQPVPLAIPGIGESGGGDPRR